jgi:type IV pilus assembly protein PilY1
LAKLNASEGWYIKLNDPEHLGEKCLSNAVLFYGVVYYTTFQPTFDPTGTDICFLGEGIARLYAVDYKTGSAVFNLDGMGTLNELTRDDRSTTLGVSIPSGVIVTFVGGTTVAYGGVGGGVFRPPLPTTKTIIPISWRMVF